VETLAKGDFGGGLKTEKGETMLDVMAIGNLGRDPEMQYTGSGAAVTNFSMACRNGRNAQGESEITWVRVTCWQKLAETAS